MRGWPLHRLCRRARRCLWPRFASALAALSSNAPELGHRLAEGETLAQLGGGLLVVARVALGQACDLRGMLGRDAHHPRAVADDHVARPHAHATAADGLVDR